MGHKATVKNKKLHGPAARRHKLNKACEAISEEIRTKEWNKNKKARKHKPLL